ncbi:MAG TPA: DUF5916 domain-containing protein [Thermoanaerobaculia bacterium]|nr:DUF5916 domain-containing protein [Thermoanaerobaculia bacterium]
MPDRHPFAALALLPALLLPSLAGAQQEPAGERPASERQAHTVARATSPVRVDGRLDEAAWATVEPIAIPWEWFPGDNTPAPVETEVFVAFDDDRLYVAFRAHDPEPGAVRAHLSDRDTERPDDVVGFEIDTFNDRRRAYRFQANPLGVQLDSQISDANDSEDLSWDAIWESAGRLTADGYVVEMAIPFRQLRFPRATEDGGIEAVQTWGFLAYRDYPRSVNHQLRSTPQDRDLDCRVCQYETIAGLAGMDVGHNLEITPTLTADRTDARPSLDAPREAGDEDFEAGLTTRWGVTSNVTLLATVNPDFSQVEADVAQLSVNERFALFFPEKRPFFLEGADFFAAPFNTVFTRTVANPEWGAKLTGKEGKSSFGVFAARDRLTNLIFPGAEASGFASLDGDLTSGVVRYRRDVGSTSTVGLLYTGREGEDGYSNHLYGADGALRLTPSDTLRFAIYESETRYPDAVAEAQGQPLGSFTGTGWRLDYTRGTREWAFRGLYQSFDDGFRADSGFVPRVGYTQSLAVAQRNFYGTPKDWYRRLQATVNYTRLDTQAGDLIEQGVNLELAYDGPWQSRVALGVRPNEEVFRGARFDNLRADLDVSVRPTGSFAYGLFVRGGEVIDFTNVRQSDFLVVRPSVEFRLGRHVTGELQHEWQEFEHEGDRFLTANLSQATLLYHLNVRAFFRAILQYQDVDRVLANYTNPGSLNADDEELFTQFLFSYKLNARTALFVGYSDQHQGTEAIDLTQRSRTFFFKVGYAFLW